MTAPALMGQPGTLVPETANWTKEDTSSKFGKPDSFLAKLDLYNSNLVCTSPFYIEYLLNSQ